VDPRGIHGRFVRNAPDKLAVKAMFPKGQFRIAVVVDQDPPGLLGPVGGERHSLTSSI